MHPIATLISKMSHTTTCKAKIWQLLVVHTVFFAFLQSDRNKPDQWCEDINIHPCSQGARWVNAALIHDHIERWVTDFGSNLFSQLPPPCETIWQTFDMSPDWNFVESILIDV